jgi:hypothetical protein
VVDIVKLRNYCLNDTHPRGRHKARVLRARLGLTVVEAESLRQALLDAARDRQIDLRPAGTGRHGRRYVLDFSMTGPAGTATLRSAWIVRVGEDVLRFLTCYVI